MKRLLDSRNPFLRKGAAAAYRVHAAAVRFTTPSEVWASHPPLLANSFPKSGTHLLLQVLEGLPAVKRWGAFYASMPSVTFRERPAAAAARFIGGMAPRELSAAHLFYDPSLPAQLADRSVKHFFIVRDLRDVVISEAHYLAGMNRWHRLHRPFRKIESLADRVSLAIEGLPESSGLDYPDVGRRFARYGEWLRSPGVHVVRFEDLVGERRDEALTAIARFALGPQHAGLDAIVRQMAATIDPARSRTFRLGATGRWRETLTDQQRNRVQHLAGDWLVRLGYEAGADW